MHSKSNSQFYEEIHSRLAGEGLPFESFMEMALYDPTDGYYTASRPAPGRQADFFTSVSVGSGFGEVLGEYLHESWSAAGKPAVYRVVEQGGHSGTLAADVLDHICAKFPAFYKSFHFLAVERSPAAMSEPRLSAHRERWETVPDLAALTPQSINHFFANELLDAFPVHLVAWRGPDHGWVERYVNADFAFVDGPLSTQSLATRLAGIDTTDFEPGYTTEVNPHIAPWLDALLPALSSQARVLVIDYGMTANRYYHPSRREGTLQAYRNHQSIPDVLADPGEQDLTAHVDFTHLQNEAESRGFQVSSFEEQSRFLTRHAAGILKDIEAQSQEEGPDKETTAWIRQFQQLLGMGPHFHVMEMIAPVSSSPGHGLEDR